MPNEKKSRVDVPPLGDARMAKSDPKFSEENRVKTSTRAMSLRIRSMLASPNSQEKREPASGGFPNGPGRSVLRP